MNPSAKSAPVIVLDRDGTLVVDRGYLGDPSRLEFLKGVDSGLRKLHLMGCRLVIITNQSGVGRGLITETQVREVHVRLLDMIHRAGARLAGIYHCPHLPEFNCGCRKPQTGLFLLAASELNFDPASSIVIGDKRSDVEFGKRVNAMTIQLSPHSTEIEKSADFMVNDFESAVKIIFDSLRLAKERKNVF